MKILLVEDTVKLAKHIETALTNAAHVVDVANFGQDGLDLALSEKYDVIILDWMLPDLDGIEIVKQIRGSNNTTPILMLTAKGETEDIVAALDEGADDYLIKPFKFEELFARIRALTRRPAPTVSETLVIDSLIIETTQKTVSRAKKTISLSKKEYALLEFLARNKNRVFSKDQLAQRVWSFESDVLPNTAQVYIGYLRKKIDEGFPNEKPLIKTIRGFGYSLSSERQE